MPEHEFIFDPMLRHVVCSCGVGGPWSGLDEAWQASKTHLADLQPPDLREGLRLLALEIESVKNQYPETEVHPPTLRSEPHER